jgi:quercetin 2,3-dioxygenase
MITLRKSKERGHAQHGWLDTYYTFSFSNYYDPRHMGFGPLRVINEDRVSPEKGFGSHGHDNMEILTYVLSGALAHKDSMGNVETLHANDLQRISAGTGIVHSEFNGSKSEPVHLLQIWLEPAKRNLTPGYEQLSLTEEQKLGKLVRVAGPEGGNGALTIHQDAEVFIGQVEAGGELAHELKPGRQAWVHLIRGEATVNGKALGTGDAAAVTAESGVTIQGAARNSEVLLFDLA